MVERAPSCIIEGCTGVGRAHSVMLIPLIPTQQHPRLCLNANVPLSSIFAPVHEAQILFVENRHLPFESALFCPRWLSTMEDGLQIQLLLDDLADQESNQGSISALPQVARALKNWRASSQLFHCWHIFQATKHQDNCFTATNLFLLSQQH